MPGPNTIESIVRDETARLDRMLSIADRHNRGLDELLARIPVWANEDDLHKNT